ncbi:BglG family transcription antiterminator [Alkalibacterium sp. 20]|uniref:BglG family transcription antiterminator n=1 Tax=Alkalibacterium sp. 20 TaxID=1798803 RepID=UPI000900038C|nr:BglG family transcription antiterminator [Alkalibacterium sp. 20]OJF94696.1 hypothetical protein AX762_07400 [Alkalibacterium sp. 20]
MYLTERSKKILKTLVSLDSGEIDIEELATEYNVSSRSIRYDLEEIDDFLTYKKIPRLKKQTRVTISLPYEELPANFTAVIKDEIETDVDYYQPKERQELIYLEILLSDTLVDIRKIMELLQVSRSTVISDVRFIRKKLQSQNVLMDYQPQKGYIFRGEEEVIRRIGLNFLNLHPGTLDSVESKILNDQYKAIESDDFSYIEQFIATIEMKLLKQYSDKAFQSIVNGMLVTIIRIKKGAKIEKSPHQKFETKEHHYLFQERKMLEDKFSIQLTRAEVSFIENLFLESSLIKSENIINDDWVDLHLFIKDFLEEMSIILEIPLEEDEELFNALALHLAPAIQRIKNKTFLKNEIVEYIQINYTEIFETVDTVLNKFGENKNLDFSLDEIGFVTIHIASAIEKKGLDNKENNVLLVCNYGIGTTKLLEIMLKKYFNFNIINTLAVREVTNEYINKNTVDLVVSTIDFAKEISVPKVVVSPLLSEKDIKKLSAYEKRNRKSRKFNQNNLQGNGENIMLKDLLIKETIELNIEAKDWKEAVKYGGKLLKNIGKIEDTYIEAMINTVEDLGPYIVIAPEIAMPHASSKDGVNEVGLSLITLKYPVEFGHPENDPVSIVICLAATDHKSHLNALKDLMGFLNDSQFIELLKSGTVDEILKEINKEKKEDDE